jgi:hypothetical protein
MGQPLTQTIYIILFNTQVNPIRYELLYRGSDYPKANSWKCGAEVKASRFEAELALWPLQPVYTHGRVSREHRWGNIMGNKTAEVALQL